MKLIIDIDEKEYRTILANAELYKATNWGSVNVWDAILNATPISTDGDLISRSALKEEVNKKRVVGRFNTLVLIDNAPSIEPENRKVVRND